MSRLPTPRRDELDSGGQAIWDAVVGPRGDSILNDEGGLAGPFNAWLLAGDAGLPILQLADALRSGSTLAPLVQELAIVTVAAHWRAEFQWWAHGRAARRLGLERAALDAIADGSTPSFATSSELVANAVAAELARTGHLPDPLYVEARAVLGERGIVELVALCGFYSLVAYTLNAFEVPLPPGVDRRWPEASGPTGQ